MTVTIADLIDALRETAREAAEPGEDPNVLAVKAFWDLVVHAAPARVPARAKLRKAA